MSLQSKATNRVNQFRRSMLALSDEAVTDDQRAFFRDFMLAVDQLQRLVDASPSLRAGTCSPSRSPFNFEGLLYRGDRFEVAPTRIKALRVAASAWSKTHGVKLSVSKIDGVGGRCTRVDGPLPPDDDSTF